MSAMNASRLSGPERLQAGNALAKRTDLAFADDNLRRSRICHDQKKAAFEVRLDLSDFRHVDKHFPAGAKELKIREIDRKSTRLNSSHSGESRMPSSA